MEPRFVDGELYLAGMDLRGQQLGHLFRPSLVGAASVEVIGDHLDVTTWREGGQEQVVRKH